MKRFSLLVGLLLSSFLVVGVNTAWAQKETNVQRLREIAREAASQWEQERAEVKAFAEERGLPVRREFKGGRVIELMRIENGFPVYNTTYNRGGAETSSVEEVWPGGSLGLSLTGDSETLGIWDGGGVRESHQEFGGRATQQDGASSLPDHATHVGGTMVAAGVQSEAQGMAYEGALDAYDWYNDRSEMATAASEGLYVSNHSYGRLTGWSWDSDIQEWRWYGDPTISETEDYSFGFYGDQAQSWDRLAFNAPRYVIVKAAGNDRGDGPSSQPVEHLVYHPDSSDWVNSTTVRDLDGGSNGYESLGNRATAKNIVTVGAVEGISGGYTSPSDVTMSDFSGWGPTDDGRIKPDLVAKGVGVYSSTAASDTSYGTYSGTSMASPMVSGSVGLLQEHYKNQHGGTYPLSSTVKSLLIHTAYEAGSSGPDYKFGWGLMNVAGATQLIQQNAEQGGYIRETALSEDEVFEYQVSSDGSDSLMATVAWTDPEGTPPSPSLDPTDRMLVNDLNVRIEGPGGTVHQPYVLDSANPSDPATTGDNTRDNVEQVLIAAPTSGTYTISVSHDGSLADGPQAFSLVMSGGSPEDPPPSAPSGLTASAGDQQVSLSWDANSESDLAGYNLYRSTSSFSNTSNATQVNGSLLSEASYTDTGVTNGQAYYYRVTAVDTSGTASGFSNEAQATPAGQGDLRITSLRPLNGVPGTTVRIYGSGFDPTASGNTVKFGSTEAKVERAETNVLYVSVPTGTGGGPSEVSVTSNGKAGTAIKKFGVVSGGDTTFNDLGAGLEAFNNASSSVADVDDDGKRDVLLTGESYARLYTRNRDGSFSASQFERSTNVDGYSSSIGDITGNGRPDLVIANEGIFLQNQDGSFSLRHPQLVSGSANTLGDFNEDGKLDLFVAGLDSTSTPSASVYLQDENGDFTSSNAGLNGIYGASSSVGDVNGDGNLDILVIGDSTEAYDKRTPATLLYLGNGSGSFEKANVDLAGVGGDILSGEATSIADLNGDGDLDLVVTGLDANRSPKTLLYFQNEDGSFSRANAGLTDVYGYAETGDINGDGNTDLLLAGYDGDKSVVHIYIQRDSGDLRRANAGIPGSASGSPTIADFDGDGQLDVLLAGESNVGDTLATTLYGNGPDTVPPKIPSNLTRSVGNLQVSFSWKANTENDLAGYNIYRSTSTIDDTADATLINNTLIEEEGYIDSSASNSTRYHYRLTAVDSSGNQSLPTEEVTATPSGDRQLTSFVETGINLRESPVATWGDYDGDGDLDIFVCCSTLYRNDGRWNFTKVDAGIRNFPAVIGDDVAGSADWGDFDGDGDLDLVVAGYETTTSGTAEIYRNEGDTDGDETVEFTQIEAGLSDFSGGGNFDYIVQAPPLGGMKRPSSQWGDYDNDGDLDLVVTGSRTAKIYRNDGEAVFKDINAELEGVDWGTSQWGDYDNDGDLDLVITGSPSDASGSSKIYENMGDDIFQPINADILGVKAGFSEWEDYDNDGDLDLVIGGGIQGATIYENQDGSFTQESPGTSEFSFPARWTGSASWGDYDQDGDPDLLVTGYARDLDGTFEDGAKQDVLTLYKNMGEGEFRYVTHIRRGTPPRSSSEWGDYDGDGDLDLLLAGDRTVILQNGIPRSVGAKFRRTFSDASSSNHYRLVALPGAIDRSLSNAISGEAGVSWQAFWDNGSSIVKHDGSDNFRFRPGRGFWLTSTEDWTVQDSVNSILRANADLGGAVTIPLHDGWNIISNPLGLSRTWSRVQVATGSNLQPLWSFNGNYRKVDTLRSAKTGEAYYFYNDRSLSSLKIPTPRAPTHPPVAKHEVDGGTEESKLKDLLSLSARSPGNDSLEASTVQVGILKGGEDTSEARKIMAPPGRFEDVSLRIRDTNRPDTARSRLLMIDQRVSAEDKEGHTFDLLLSTRREEQVRLVPENLDAIGKSEVRLLNRNTGQSYNLRNRDEVTLKIGTQQIELHLAIGTKSYVDEERDEIIPERVSLTAYPNPMRQQGTLEYTLPKARKVQLTLYDILGRKVATLEQDQKQAGRHRARLDVSNLPSGVYFGRLRVGDQTHTQKITVVR